MKRLFAVADKVHARVGVYMNEDMRNYVFKQDKSGAPIQMEVGRSLTPVCMTIGSAIFDSAVQVDSLPPYTGNYRPDVEAVIEPEILYAYGSTTGVFAGQLTAIVKLRIKTYDLSGRIIWQGEALGENRGEQVDLVSSLLGNVDKSAKAAGHAGISAAIAIIKDFNLTKPPELYSLLEVKAASPQSRGKKKTGAEEQAERLFLRGMYQYDKKNFQQALYSFHQSDRLNPDDLSTKFYVGVCQMYTGQKRRAIDILNNVLSNSKRGDSLAVNSRQWIQRLNDPLKVSIVFTGLDGSMPPDIRQNFFQGLRNCGMYEIVSIQDAPGPISPDVLNRYIAESSKKKARIILVIQADKSSRDLLDATLREGDTASEFVLNTNVKAYSTQKKKAISEFNLFDNAARMKKDMNPDLVQSAIQQRNANRLVLSLLGDEIF